MNIISSENKQLGFNLMKSAVVKSGFFALGRALQSASLFEEDVKKEVEKLHDGFSFTMTVLPNGPTFSMQKKGESLVYMGLKLMEKADLVVEIKNLNTAYKMITTQMGAHHVFAQNKINVIGSTKDSMIIIRLIYIIEGYLFPEILNKKILKQPPKMTVKKQINRFHIYTLGLLFGK